MSTALFLIDITARKLILRPCGQNERDAVRICTTSSNSKKPRHIRSTEFNNRIFEFMQWDEDCRYRVAGNIVLSSGETLVVFDLCAAEKFKLSIRDANTRKKSTDSSLESGFGATVAERTENPLVTQIIDDTTIPINAVTSGGLAQ
jgi:hypothetical protein